MNQLKVNQQQSIIALFEQGWSKRRIARELGLDRLPVRRYLAAATAVSKSPTPRTGSDEAVEAKSPTNPRTGSGPKSLCGPYQPAIEAALEADQETGEVTVPWPLHLWEDDFLARCGDWPPETGGLHDRAPLVTGRPTSFLPSYQRVLASHIIRHAGR